MLYATGILMAVFFWLSFITDLSKRPVCLLQTKRHQEKKVLYVLRLGFSLGVGWGGGRWRGSPPGGGISRGIKAWGLQGDFVFLHIRIFSHFFFFSSSSSLVSLLLLSYPYHSGKLRSGHPSRDLPQKVCRSLRVPLNTPPPPMRGLGGGGAATKGSRSLSEHRDL